MATGGWSSLPSDLVNRVADLLLADNDLDYYTALRAVCSGWRAATADPRVPDAGPRFRPLHWVLLDEASRTGSRLFVNAATGRFLRRDLPVLDKFRFVTTTAGGLLVLAERGPPPTSAARVLNPFTGSMIRFVAPIPGGIKAASAVLGSSSTTLVLFCESSRTVYFADTVVESFAAYPETEYFLCPLYTVAIRSGVCAASKGASPPPPPPSAMLGLVRGLDAMKDTARRCFMVESAAAMEILVIVRSQGVVEVMNMDPVRCVLEPVASLGGRALFLGKRSLSVEADKFPSIQANCVYYVDCSYWRRSGIYKHDMADGKEERVDDALIPFVNPVTYLDDDLWPYTVIQLLSSYAVNVPEPQLDDREDFPFRVRFTINRDKISPYPQDFD